MATRRRWWGLFEGGGERRERGSGRRKRGWEKGERDAAVRKWERDFGVSDPDFFLFRLLFLQLPLRPRG